MCKIYSSSSSLGDEIIGFIDGMKIYSTSSSFGGKLFYKARILEEPR
jgi:hypothetical protein